MQGCLAPASHPPLNSTSCHCHCHATKRQAALLVHYANRVLSPSAFSIAGLPGDTLSLPQTMQGHCWLLVMFLSSMLGIVLPLLRWYLYEKINSNLAPHGPLLMASSTLDYTAKETPVWDKAQVVVLACGATSAAWIFLSMLACMLE